MAVYDRHTIGSTLGDLLRAEETEPVQHIEAALRHISRGSPLAAASALEEAVEQLRSRAAQNMAMNLAATLATAPGRAVRQ